MASAVAAQSMRDEMMVMDSLRSIHPRLRAAWLRARGFPDAARPSLDSQSLRVVGRWSFGPAADVDGSVTPTETIVALARGSGVSLLRLSRGESLRVSLLSDINSDGLTYQVRIRDSLLLVSTGAGLDLYNIVDVSNPIRLSTIGMVCTGFDLRDSLLYALGNNDSFRVYSIAEPAAPRLLGACRDSGGSVSVAGNTAFLAEGGGLYAIDISNPASPHRVGSYPGWAISATARGNICCVTWGNSNEPTWLRFSVMDVSDPANMRQIGYIDSCGGYDVCLDGSLAFVSGYYTGNHEFEIVSLADSSHPTRVGSCATLSNNFGVWASLASGSALVADDFGGLDVIDITNINQPRIDSVALRVGFAKDISVAGNICYVASDAAGMKVLDVSDPSAPTWIGDLDTAYNNLTSWAVAARDSFAYTCWSYPYLRTIDVTDPAKPQMVASCSVFRHPEDMVLRDSFLYCAEDYRFQVVNVARPRAPVVVGTCALQNASLDLFVADSLAYVSNWPSPIINISDPGHPEAVGNFPMPLGGVYVRDTFAYLAMSYDSMFVYSVANPALPVRLGSLDFSGGRQYAEYNLDIEVLDTIAYIGGWHLKTVSVADPRNPREVGERWDPPSSYISRLTYAAPYLYVACSDGGVCIMETLQAGISEPARRPAASRISVTPSLTRGPVRVAFCVPGKAFDLEVFDVTGNLIQSRTGSMRGAQTIDLTSAPDGAYLVMVKTDVGMSTTKVVKTRR